MNYRPDIDPVLLYDPSQDEERRRMAMLMSRYIRHHRQQLEVTHGPGRITLLVCVSLLAALITLLGA